jgi:hypothetical protein
MNRRIAGKDSKASKLPDTPILDVEGFDVQQRDGCAALDPQHVFLKPNLFPMLVAQFRSVLF